MINDLKLFVRKHRIWLIPVLFVLMAYLDVAYLQHFHTVYYNPGYELHLYRIRSVASSWATGHLPFLNRTTTVPYGAALTFYPYLTLLPLALVALLVKNSVDLFYIIVFLISLTAYLVSYYGLHTYDHHWTHDFLFALFYTNNSILFNWLIHFGDVGCGLALAFAPLAFIGFLDLLKYRTHWFMMTTGLILVMLSHLITGGLLILALVILGIANARRLNRYVRHRMLMGAVIFVIATSVFWYPDLQLAICNHIVVPANVPSMFPSGIFSWINSPANYVYSLTMIIGALSIVKWRSTKFTRMDLWIWGIGIASVLINIKWLAALLVRCLPPLKYLQFSFRFSTVAYLLLTFLAVRWLTGEFNEHTPHDLKLLLTLMCVVMVFSPLANQITCHFLLQKRPVATASNFNRLTNRGSNPMKFTQKSFYQLRHHYSNCDYFPSSKLIKGVAFNNTDRMPVWNWKGKWEGVKYTPTNRGIVIRNRHYTNLQFPIVVYRGVNYTFTLNGHRIARRDVNVRLTRKNYELTLRRLPEGKDTVTIHSAVLK